MRNTLIHSGIVLSLFVAFHFLGRNVTQDLSDYPKGLSSPLHHTKFKKKMGPVSLKETRTDSEIKSPKEENILQNAHPKSGRFIRKLREVLAQKTALEAPGHLSGPVHRKIKNQILWLKKIRLHKPNFSPQQNKVLQKVLLEVIGNENSHWLVHREAYRQLRPMVAQLSARHREALGQLHPTTRYLAGFDDRRLIESIIGLRGQQ